MGALGTLSDDAFIEEVSLAIHENDWFADFIEPEVIERTRSALISIKSHIASQLTTDDWSDYEWRKRATNKLRRVDSRLAQIKGLRANLSNDSNHIRKEWSNFAFQIAAVLESSNMEAMLDEIFLGKMSARDLLNAKRRLG